ncbi:MAG TPA: CBS domain-containing protein [Bryobacteraceae bacterium]
MKICDIMVPNPTPCHPGTNLAEAAALMWEHNCGALPVVDRELRVQGMITDRDICIALGTRNLRAADISVSQVMSGRVFVCSPDSDIHEALRCMREHHVRRLPVVAHDGRLEGILCIDDIVLNAQWAETRTVDLSFRDVIRVLRGVTYPARPCAAAIAA